MTALVYSSPSLQPCGYDPYTAVMSGGKERSEDQPSPFKGEFSFVNKDARNIDSKDHNAAVSWHVMNRYERWKKQEQARKLRASANVPIGPLSPPSSASSSSQQHQQHQRGRQSNQAHSPSRRKAPYLVPNRRRLTDRDQAISLASPSSHGFDPWTADPALSLSYAANGSIPISSISPIPTSTSSTPSTLSGAMDDDPASALGSIATPLELSDKSFDSPNVPITPLVSSLVNFAYEYLIPQMWPKESLKLQGSYEIARSLDDTAMINQDGCYANAYLSLLASAMAAAIDDDSLIDQARYFQAQAMIELRHRVASQSTQELITLKAILKLFSSETLVDNTSTARTHLKMLRNLVNNGGGVILLDSWFREDLLSCDCYFAMKYETRPLFPAQEWTPGPLSQPWKARLVSAGIIGDHAAGIDPLIEHSTVKGVITDLRELFKAEEYAQIHDIPADDQVLRWRQLRKFDCISRLADHYVNVVIYPHLYSNPIIQAYSCIATSLVTNMILGSPEPVRFGVKLVNDLRKKLMESISEGEASSFRRLRLWALYVGCLGEQVHPMGVEHATWFAASYHRLADEMGISAWEDQKKILRQFLFSEKLREEVESGRAHRSKDVRPGLYSASGCSWREPLIDPCLMGSAEKEGGPPPGGSGVFSLAGP